MDEDEMKHRLEEGQLPIDVSIEKWQQIVDGEDDLVSGANYDNCALCYNFWEDDCNGCPLLEIDECCLNDSVYLDYEIALSREQDDIAMKYANKLLKALKKCKRLGLTGVKEDDE
jgi:hypothetical protein